MQLGSKPNIDIAAEMIKCGVVIELTENNPFSDLLSITDFKKFGWCNKWSGRSQIAYQWLGPNPVKVNGKILNHGDYTETIDVDNT